jgi:hypothetical protein
LRAASAAGSVAVLLIAVQSLRGLGDCCLPNDGALKLVLLPLLPPLLNVGLLNAFRQ